MLRTWLIAGIALAASTDLHWRRIPLLASKCSSDCAPPDAKIKLGPPLNGIDGRKSGTFDAFNYSPASKSSGITWSEETFHKYIRAPMQEMPGTRTAFVGIKNDNDIADLWAYLRQTGPDGAKK